MSMDELGNIYISNGQGVMGFDPAGNNILIIPTGGGATNNTFAGRDDKLLFITGPVDSGSPSTRAKDIPKLFFATMSPRAATVSADFIPRKSP